MPAFWDLWKDKRTPEERAQQIEELKKKLSQKAQAVLKKPIRRNSDGNALQVSPPPGGGSGQHQSLSNALSGLSIDGNASASTQGFVGGFQ